MKNSLITRIINKIKWIKYKILDPRRIHELSGERVVFQELYINGFLKQFEDKRILEIGPKHGKDSLLLAKLKPKILYLIDLASKSNQIKTWLPKVANLCDTKYIEGNILYLTKASIEELGKFDLIWCLGVLYHNVEQLRLLRKLFLLCNEGGYIVLESATTRNMKLRNMNVIELHWPKPYDEVPTITHLPSRKAIYSWLEMVGFANVKICDVYSKRLSKDRAVFTAVRNKDSKTYISYDLDEIKEKYTAGDSY